MQNQTNTNFQIKHYKINSSRILGKGATGFVYQGFSTLYFSPQPPEQSPRCC